MPAADAEPTGDNEVDPTISRNSVEANGTTNYT